MIMMVVEDSLARYQKVIELETLVKIYIVTVKKHAFQRMGIKQWDEEIVQ
jgi:hypothetical protein